MNTTTENILALANSLSCANADARTQDRRHEENARCKPADFSASAFYLNRLNVIAGLPEISTEEVEKLIRSNW